MMEGLRRKLRWLDPFTYVDKFVMPALNPRGNEILKWCIYLVFAFLFAYALYSALGFLLGTASPMVIVVSGSMEPTLYRGDVIALQGVAPAAISAKEVSLARNSLQEVPLSDIARLAYEIGDDGLVRVKQIEFYGSGVVEVGKSGDIVVYYSPLKKELIIHRAIAKIKAGDGYYFLTKGDNHLKNTTLDQDCGAVRNSMPEKPCISLYPVPAGSLQGRLVFRVPLIGYVKLLVFDDIPNFLMGR